MSAQPADAGNGKVAAWGQFAEILELQQTIAQLRRATNLANAALAILASGDLTGRDAVTYAQTAHADLLDLIPPVTP